MASPGRRVHDPITGKSYRTTKGIALAPACVECNRPAYYRTEKWPYDFYCKECGDWWLEQEESEPRA